MAILTPEQLAELRRSNEPAMVPVGYTKIIINTANQAIETWFEDNRASLSASIDSSTSPYVFTNPEKRRLVKWWCRQKFDRGG